VSSLAGQRYALKSLQTQGVRSRMLSSSVLRWAEQERANAYDTTDSGQWSSYTKYRPKYPTELFNRIYDYHTLNKGVFDTAHDAGCGPGITARQLLPWFSKVICSDLSGQAVSAAEKYLHKFNESGAELIFRHAPAEDMSWIPEDSVDLVTMSECLHWTDTAKTTSAIWRTLKPGGTFAAWYYGNPQFPDCPALTPIFLQTIGTWCKQRADYSKEARRTIFIEFTGYDCVALREADGWMPGIQRVTFNTNGSKDIWIRDRDLAHMRFPLQIGPEDECIHVKDAPEWQHHVDLDWLRGWFESMFPRLEERYLASQLLQMSKTLGDGGNTRAVWPVSLILATKSRQRQGFSAGESLFYLLAPLDVVH
jgi:trans-aconitate 3-methyltransferase